MRFSTILAASAMAILSVVSAQSVPDPAAMVTCGTCMNEAGIAAVPACKGLENTKATPGTPPTDKQKACWCGLKSNNAWGDSCVESGKCTAESKAYFVRMVATAIAQQPGICDNVSTTSAGNRFCGSSSAKVAAAGAAAVAIAGALL